MFDSAVTELARGVVVELFPEELPVFSVVSKAYFDAPEATLTGKNRQGGPLGWGLAETVTMMSPVVLWVAQNVVEPYIPKAADAVKDKLLGIFRRRKADEQDRVSLPPLNPARRNALREIAIAAARERGVNVDLANRIADALLAQIPAEEDEAQADPQ